MDLAERAYWTGVWRIILATLCFAIVALCYIHSLGNALLAAAYIALIFAVGMWIDAPRWPIRDAQRSILRFAQTGAAAAIALCLFSRMV